MRVLLIPMLLAGCAQPEDLVTPPRTPAPRWSETSRFTVDASPPEDIAGIVARASDGWTASGAPVRGDLAAVPQMRWPARRGRCYVGAIVVLDEDASAPGASLSFRMETPHDANATTGGFERGSKRVMTVRLYDSCPTEAGTIELAFETGSTKTTSPGSGGFVAQLYDVPVSEEELRAIEDDAIREECVACMRERLTCQKTGETGDHPTCEAQFNACVGPNAKRCKP